MQEANLNQLSISLQLAKNTGKILKEVQTERDFTYGFLRGKPTGSEGKSYQARLLAQRLLVDKTINNYKNYT